MPKIYRGMKQEQDKPALGPTAQTLGARVPEDIAPDAAGMVHPGTGGMSVAPSLADLPSFRVPARLHKLYPKASGKSDLFVWSMGVGEFAEEPIGDQLCLRFDPANGKHGFIEPVGSMSLNDYQNALTATQDQWAIDEK